MVALNDEYTMIWKFSRLSVIHARAAQLVCALRRFVEFPFARRQSLSTFTDPHPSKQAYLVSPDNLEERRDWRTG
jgi:hypothetical protein